MRDPPTPRLNWRVWCNQVTQGVWDSQIQFESGTCHNFKNTMNSRNGVPIPQTEN